MLEKTLKSAIAASAELTLDGGSIDLNGHVLTVKNVTGSGVIVDASNASFRLLSGCFPTKAG